MGGSPMVLIVMSMGMGESPIPFFKLEIAQITVLRALNGFIIAKLFGSGSAHGALFNSKRGVNAR